MKIRQGEISLGGLIFGLAISSAIVAILSFAIGAKYGARSALDVVQETESKRVEAQTKVKSWECTIAQSEATRALEKEWWNVTDTVVERDYLAKELTRLYSDVLRSHASHWNLKIRWGRSGCGFLPGYPILIFKSEKLRDIRFTDKNGFIFPHMVSKGEKAIYLGRTSERGKIVVLCLTGDYAGMPLTIESLACYPKQRAFIYF